MAGGKFSLPDNEGEEGEGEMLTHLGRSLAEIQDINEVRYKASFNENC